MIFLKLRLFRSGKNYLPAECLKFDKRYLPLESDLEGVLLELFLLSIMSKDFRALLLSYALDILANLSKSFFYLKAAALVEVMGPT